MFTLAATLVFATSLQMVCGAPAPILLPRAIASLPIAEIVCPDTRDGSDPATASVAFNDFQIEDAAQRGMFSEPGTSDPNPGGYASSFRNDEAFVFANCNNGNLFEYPILAGGNVYGGGDPGPFRVIFTPDPDFASRNGIYCGTVYHPRAADGSQGRNFALCT
ncbi:hypothetical protein K431DRAFT_294320 [Polychaeton citri CBS 116435]|uniref:ribonuclease T1 n=1 Tax=Polychaeton citri CBS 116435 TaxID=1314669 RepID=A0A9P4UP85_9PEZI|nr:hypothetical protein K431DRAFT_294320 [Polychaeton citri CBS 116435]